MSGAVIQAVYFKESVWIVCSVECSESDLKVCLNREYYDEEREKKQFSVTELLGLIEEVNSFLSPKRSRPFDNENMVISLLIENIALLKRMLEVDAVGIERGSDG